MRLWPLWLYGLTIASLTIAFLYGPTALQFLFRTTLGGN